VNRRARTDGGFTLIELLVVLAIAALLFVLVAPSGARQRDRAELARSARAIAAGLQATRSRAIIDNRPSVFGIDVDSRRFTGAGENVVGELPRGASFILTTTADEAASASLAGIRFFPDGSSTGGGIVLTRGSDRSDILVDWLTGAVSIHEQHAPPR
jgi:general secretion pathway protein H